jgi:hypothetical protein
MVKKTVAAAATYVADFIRGGPRVDHREILIVNQKRGEWRIIQPPKPRIEKEQKVKQNVLDILRPALPWINGMNVIDRRGNQRFIDHHVQYDVVQVGFCEHLGLPKGTTPEMALQQQGFKIIPLKGHPFEVDVRRVLQL